MQNKKFEIISAGDFLKDLEHSFMGLPLVFRESV